MSRSRRLRRQQAAVGLALELICLFFLGFVASSVVGVAVAWILGMHHPEPHPLDEDSRVTVPYAEGRVSWLRPADQTSRDECGGSPSSWESWRAPYSGGSCFALPDGDRPQSRPPRDG
jgi:hypothetical protein